MGILRDYKANIFPLFHAHTFERNLSQEGGGEGTAFLWRELHNPQILSVRIQRKHGDISPNPACP